MDDLHECLNVAGSSINVMVRSRGHVNDWEHFAEEADDEAWGYRSACHRKGESFVFLTSRNRSFVRDNVPFTFDSSRRIRQMFRC